MERISKRVLHKPQGILGCSMKQGMEEPKWENFHQVP
jgi:hypothetical protein